MEEEDAKTGKFTVMRLYGLNNRRSSQVLYINPIGGLANRMRALAGGISLAQDLGVDFKLVWLKNWELYAEFDDIFEMPEELLGRVSYPDKVTYGILYSPPRLKNLYISSMTLRRYGLSFLGSNEPYFDIAAAVDSGSEVKRMFEQGFAKRDKCFLQGGIHLYPFDLELYRHLFKPSENIKKVVDERIAELGENRYGVHIRRTDNIESIRKSPDEIFIKEMNRRLTVNSEIRFYLSTDSEEVKLKFKREFGEKVRFSPKVARRDTVDGIKEAAIELFTLANTKAILGSYFSSFSEAASLLGDVPLKEVRVKT